MNRVYGDTGLQIQPAVLTSSSDRRLHDFVAEVAINCNCRHFEIYAFRNSDVRAISSVLGLPSGVVPFDARDVLSCDLKHARNQIKRIAEWIKKELELAASVSNKKLVITNIATFFPAINSLEEEISGVMNWPSNKVQQRDQNCLRNSILLAVELKSLGLMPYPIVELVCGALYEPHFDEQSRKKYFFRSTFDAKKQKLSKSLRAIAEELDEIKVSEWLLLLELEPGPAFLLSDSDRLTTFLPEILADDVVGERVGLNLDIAHMKLAGVSPRVLREFKNDICHGHICDLPGMHTRDQPVGHWDAIERLDSEVYDYLQVLRDSYASTSRKKPFTGAVSVELEGCNDVRWVIESINAVSMCVNRLPLRSQLSSSVPTPHYDPSRQSESNKATK